MSRREPHMRNRNSSYHPAPILVQLPGLTGVLPRICVFWPCLGTSPETVAVRPVGVPGAVRMCGGTQAPGNR